MIEEPATIMGLRIAATFHYAHQMEMCHHMGMARSQGSPAIATTTMGTWLMNEDMLLPGIPIHKKVLKRREIETINPLEISTQVSISLSV